MFANPRRGRQARHFTTNVPKILDFKSSSEQIFSKNCRWVPLIFVADQHEAPSTHIRFCLKTGFFFWFWLTVHMYQVKMAIEDASFQKCSQSRGFELSVLLHSCGCTKMEVFGNDYVTVLDTSKCACFHKRWVPVFSQVVFSLLDGQKRTLFIGNREKHCRFQTKTDMCGREMKLGTKWFQPSLNVSFLCFLTL